jgi:translocation and assembly module TamA
VDGVGSAYLKFDEAGRHVLAFRARLGSVIAGDAADVPAGRRLYSGGGGSVRGYSERSIGPENSRGEPSGGLSVVEAGLEMRSRFWGDVGGALFVEGGSVSEEVAPVFDEGVQMAAGGGLRYFSPVGPIRVDVGVPVNPRDSDDAFQVYLSIGQAF